MQEAMFSICFTVSPYNLCKLFVFSNHASFLQENQAVLTEDRLGPHVYILYLL